MAFVLCIVWTLLFSFRNLFMLTTPALHTPCSLFISRFRPMWAYGIVKDISACGVCGTNRDWIWEHNVLIRHLRWPPSIQAHGHFQIRKYHIWTYTTIIYNEHLLEAKQNVIQLEDLPHGNRSHGKLQKQRSRSKFTRISKGARREITVEENYELI